MLNEPESLMWVMTFEAGGAPQKGEVRYGPLPSGEHMHGARVALS